MFLPSKIFQNIPNAICKEDAKVREVTIFWEVMRFKGTS
jgi:hypothetical protein